LEKEKIIGGTKEMIQNIKIAPYYGSLQGMKRKFDKYARQDFFKGSSIEEFEQWKTETRNKLSGIIGLQYMEECPLNPVVLEGVEVAPDILRQKVLLQVEPEVFMPVFILIPRKHLLTKAGKEKCFLALPGHMGAGKYSVAGCYDIPAVKEKIEFFNYDYGMKLAKLGYVTFCPDCRGFGERRDEAVQGDEEGKFLNSSCFHLAHMAEPMGQTVIGMLTWDFMRLIEYIETSDNWDTEELGCVGVSGGGMQTLWLSALDERIKRVIISGYMYGYKDSLMILNGNCNCNYVPGLWRHYDMGDIGSLIAPRELTVQSCREDKLNGPRGLDNVYEQVDIIRAAYALYGKEELLTHDIREGTHCFHQEILK